MKHFFDCIVADGGCAGLSLAYHLVEHDHSDKILVLDRESKSSNGRIWCWWSKTPTSFDALLTHERYILGIADCKSPFFSSITSYRYWLLHSASFYSFIYGRLVQCTNVSFRQASMLSKLFSS